MKRKQATTIALALCAVLLLQAEMFCACHASETSPSAPAAKTSCPSCHKSQSSATEAHQPTTDGAKETTNGHQSQTGCCCRSHDENQPRQIELASPVTTTSLQTFIAVDTDASCRIEADGPSVTIRSHSPPPSHFKIPLYLSKASLLI